MSKEWVTVYTHILIAPVDVARATLEAENIICLLKGYDMTRPQLSFGTGIQLQVQEKDRIKAEAIIKGLDIAKKRK